MVTADTCFACDGAVTDVNTDVVRFNGLQEHALAVCGSCASVPATPVTPVCSSGVCGRHVSEKQGAALASWQSKAGVCSMLGRGEARIIHLSQAHTHGHHYPTPQGMVQVHGRLPKLKSVSTDWTAYGQTDEALNGAPITDTCNRVGDSAVLHVPHQLQPQRDPPDPALEAGRPKNLWPVRTCTKFHSRSNRDHAGAHSIVLGLPPSQPRISPPSEPPLSSINEVWMQ
jgi:hypothetical protein